MPLPCWISGFQYHAHRRTVGVRLELEDLALVVHAFQ